MMHPFFLHFNPSQSHEKTSLLSIMSAPNMVPSSYITTGNKHKMTAPNKGTALQGCMDCVPRQHTGVTAKTVGDEHLCKRAPCWSDETQAAPQVKRACLCLSLVQLWRASEDIIKPVRTKTLCSLLWCTCLYPLRPTITHCSGRSHSLWIQ